MKLGSVILRGEPGDEVNLQHTDTFETESEAFR